MNTKASPIGSKYGMLTVLSQAETDRFYRTRWNVRCDCGAEKVVALYQMKSGHTSSCGCIKSKGNPTHGKSGTPTHNTWCAMKQRCNYPEHDSYEYYGARGVVVCQRWSDSFEAFLADMGERPEGMTIDRIDSYGHYEPGNCRWAPEDEQARNRRSTILVERDGRKMCIKDWCEELGLDIDRVYGRIRRGAAPAEALQ